MKSTRATAFLITIFVVAILLAFESKMVIELALLLFKVIIASPNSSCTNFGDLVNLALLTGKLFINSACALAAGLTLNTSPTASSMTFSLCVNLKRNLEENL